MLEMLFDGITGMSDDAVEPTVTHIEDPREGTVAVRVEVMIRGRYYAEVGSAKCARHDQYDPQIGYQLAAGRAFRQIGRNMLSEGNRAVHDADKEREHREAAAATAEAERQKKARKAAKKMWKEAKKVKVRQKPKKSSRNGSRATVPA